MSKNHQNNSNSNILLGVLAGTIVGALAAAAGTSQRGKKFREDLYDSYQDASKKFSNATHDFAERTHGLSDRFLHRNHRSSNHKNLTIGAIAGGILGISAIIYLASDSAKGIRHKMLHSFENITDKTHSIEDIADRFGEKITPWVKKAGRFIDSLNENEHSHSRNYASSNGTTLDKILDWAVIAAHTFQSLKK